MSPFSFKFPSFASPLNPSSSTSTSSPTTTNPHDFAPTLRAAVVAGAGASASRFSNHRNDSQLIGLPNRSFFARAKMPLFITIRACLYGTVLLFTLICLAMAGHFQHVLAASDLTRFVPFAIFVCTVSMLMFILLLASSFLLRERNPVSTRIELGCLGFAGFLWLVLGVFLTTSESQDADVECFSSATDLVPVDDSAASFHTNQYHAMYRVLMTFSLMNAMLVLLAFLALLFLALRRHRMGDEHMWHGPVTSCAWFNDYGNNKPQRRKASAPPILPTVEKTRGARPPFGGNAAYTTPAVPAGVPHRQHRSKGHSSHRDRNGGYASRKQQRRDSDGSMIGSSISSHDYDSGKIRNPNDEKQYRR